MRLKMGLWPLGWLEFDLFTVLSLFPFFALSSCAVPGFQQIPGGPSAKSLSPEFRIQSVMATEPNPPQFLTIGETPKKPDFELRFQVGQQSQKKIKIPEQGTFKLSIEAGPDSSKVKSRDDKKDPDEREDVSGYKILDRDATDGLARIAVPASQLHDIYLRLQNPFEDDECEDKKGDDRHDDKNKHPECQPNPGTTSLQVTDALYQVDQSLKASTSNSWYFVPRRPLPVPTGWYSPDQEKYVLTFQNKGVKGFVSRWFKRTGQPDIPLSVKVIPRVDCIYKNQNGGYTAFVGYNNLMPGIVSLPVGDSNQFTPGAADRGQPTTFATGQSPVYPTFTSRVRFDSSQLTWTLGARSVTVHANEPNLQCPGLGISDVQLTQTGQSIKGKDAPASIQARYDQDNMVELSLIGNFVADDVVSELAMRFTYEPGLLHQTFIANLPATRVLLDDDILLEPVSVGPQLLKVRINSKQLPDLFMEGLHRLSLTHQGETVSTEVRIGPPLASVQLTPVIKQIQVELDAQGRQAWVHLTGTHFPVARSFHKIVLDGKSVDAYQTEVMVQGDSQLWIAIPDPIAFAARARHDLVYGTPYGVLVREF